MDVRFDHAVFIQEHKNEIEAVICEFKEVCSKIMCNTLVQMTNPDLIEDIIQASDFVFNNDITPTSLKLIINVIESAKEYIERDDFKKCDESIRELSSLLTKASNR